MPTLRYEGCSHFRMRLAAATLSGKSLRVDNIRTEVTDDHANIGLQDFEANFLRLVDEISDGCVIEVNETGTKLLYKPGILTGGKISHDCGTSRSIGWFIEGILPLLLFCKEATKLTLTGITNDAADLSVDTLIQVTLPLLRYFGAEGVTLTIKRRGAAPKGGGIVELYCPVVRTLKPVYMLNSGKVRRVRGVVYCSRISPTVITRVIESAKKVLKNVVTDVFINSDHYKGPEGGLSAGYSIFLMAESTTGATLSIERAAVPGGQGEGGELPEVVGQQAALLLLEEMCLGGVVDRAHQSLALHLMVLGSEDVCKVRFGRELTSSAVATLRILRDAYGVTFKIKQATTSMLNVTGTKSGDVSEEEDSEDEEDVVEGEGQSKKEMLLNDRNGSGILLSARKQTDESGTLELSCLGIGYSNMSRRIK